VLAGSHALSDASWVWMARAISKCPNCVGVLAAVFAPVMGALLTGYFAYDANRNGRDRLRNLMIVLLGFSLVGVFAYARLWGGLILGL
jgi:hypothetical protein